LEELSFDHEVLEWITEALRQSHEDEKGYHDEASSRLQDRIDAMYVDKLDEKIDGSFFDKKAREWRKEQDRILCAIEEHQDASQSYLDEGIRFSNSHAVRLSCSKSRKPVRNGDFSTFYSRTAHGRKVSLKLPTANRSI